MDQPPRAKTLAELLIAVQLMIDKYGPDAQWWGWDDGDIAVLPKDGQQDWIMSGHYDS